jgi:hypothetical protein
MVQPLIKFTVSTPPAEDLVNDVISRIERLSDMRVLVGVPEATAGRLGEKVGERAVAPLSSVPGADQSVGNNNAALAYIHNFGSPEANIPPRPFLVPGVQNALPKLNRAFQMAASSALNGQWQEVEQAMHAVGLMCQNEVRRKITMGPFVPLADSTVKGRMSKRKHRKATRSDMRPLNDTGRLRQAQTYAIEKHGQQTFVNPVEGGGQYSSVTGIPG